jgi:hypothetical protein
MHRRVRSDHGGVTIKKSFYLNRAHDLAIYFDLCDPQRSQRWLLQYNQNKLTGFSLSASLYYVILRKAC